MTIKEYYKDPFLLKCTGKVLEKTKDGIIFDRTVAFPEGGGQEGDAGTLKNLKTGEIIKFNYTSKQGGRRINLEDFDSIKVETKVIHHLNEEELNKVTIEEEYEISIDVERRAKLTLNHSGIHIVLMMLENLRPDIKDRIFGAKISGTYARLDFKVFEKFSQDELSELTSMVNDVIKEKKQISTYPHSEEKEALYWSCDKYVIPCGGTHLTSTEFLGEVSIKRKNLGKNSERIIATFSNYNLPYHLYHE